MTLNIIIPRFWNHYFHAISSLLIGDMVKWIDHSEYIFPRAAKCSFESFGPSGTIQQFDALCLLPLNILNQKLFLIVWIWYITQLVVIIFDLMYWIIVSYSETVRVYILRQKSMRSVSHKQILHASCKAHLGHFFILNQIAKNINPITFVELLSNLAHTNQIANEST